MEFKRLDTAIPTQLQRCLDSMLVLIIYFYLLLAACCIVGHTRCIYEHCAWSMLLLLVLEGIRKRADVRQDLDLERVAMLQRHLGLAHGAHPSRRAGQDEGAGCQGGRLAQEGDELGNGEDQVAGAVSSMPCKAPFDNLGASRSTGQAYSMPSSCITLSLYRPRILSLAGSGMRLLLTSTGPGDACQHLDRRSSHTRRSPIGHD